MAPLPKSKAKPAKVVKGAVADAVSFGSVNITKEDVKTIAAMVRFGAVQVSQFEWPSALQSYSRLYLRLYQFQGRRRKREPEAGNHQERME